MDVSGASCPPSSHGTRCHQVLVTDSRQVCGVRLHSCAITIIGSSVIHLRHKELYWLLGRTPRFSVGNKLLLHKSIITPVWTNGIELWGCACKSIIEVIQRRQSKILRATVDAPRYVTNDKIHKDLGIPTYTKSSTT